MISIGYRNAWADEQLISAGPIEFAEMMSGAAAVVTNFFHGCVFALLNGKPWVSVPSDYRAIKIPDLAATVGASDRLIGPDMDPGCFDRLLDTPIQPHVAARIDELRSHSSAFLDAALA